MRLCLTSRISLRVWVAATTAKGARTTAQCQAEVMPDHAKIQIYVRSQKASFWQERAEWAADGPAVPLPTCRKQSTH